MAAIYWIISRISNRNCWTDMSDGLRSTRLKQLCHGQRQQRLHPRRMTGELRMNGHRGSMLWKESNVGELRRTAETPIFVERTAMGSLADESGLLRASGRKILEDGSSNGSRLRREMRSVRDLDKKRWNVTGGTRRTSAGPPASLAKRRFGRHPSQMS